MEIGHADPVRSLGVSDGPIVHVEGQIGVTSVVMGTVTPERTTAQARQVTDLQRSRRPQPGDPSRRSLQYLDEFQGAEETAPAGAITEPPNCRARRQFDVGGQRPAPCRGPTTSTLRIRRRDLRVRERSGADPHERPRPSAGASRASRSPPHPNTQPTRPPPASTSERALRNTRSSASGVWA